MACGELESHPDQPEWLSHVNASVRKVKLAIALMGISAIHVLKTFCPLTCVFPQEPAQPPDDSHL